MIGLNKSLILKMLRESNSIETFILNRCFKSVWVGENLKQLIETSKRKMNL